MRDILDLVKPTPEARYAVFYSLADGADGGRYYDVHKIERRRLSQSRFETSRDGDAGQN
jgi:methionine sulfoxide reductase catalytic subunit